MINVTGFVTVEGGINNVLGVKGEEIAVVNTCLIIFNFTLVADWHSDLFSHIFDHDVFRVESKWDY